MGPVATSFSGFLVSNLRATLAYCDKFRANYSIFSRVSLSFCTSTLTVRYVLTVVFLFDFHLPCLHSMYITVIQVISSCI